MIKRSEVYEIEGDRQTIIPFGTHFAAITAFLSYTYLSRQAGPQKAPEVETMKIWVAKENIPAREIIMEEMVQEVEKPVSDKLNTYIEKCR